MIWTEDCSGLILAGGKSSRMGENKALLQLDGKNLLQWQVEKFRHLGVTEILVSGPEELALPGTRTVQDIYPDCGPISGLHAGLISASRKHCLVIGVDMPLVPETLFHALYDVHESGVTILGHSGGEEPLLGIYDQAVAPVLENMIQQRIYAVRKLGQYVPFRSCTVSGIREQWLCNCNTPGDFEQAKQFLAEDSKTG